MVMSVSVPARWTATVAPLMGVPLAFVATPKTGMPWAMGGSSDAVVPHRWIDPHVHGGREMFVSDGDDALHELHELDAEGLIRGGGGLPLRVGHHGSQSSTVSTSLVWRWAASGTRAAATVCHSCEAAWTASALPSSMCLERSSQMASVGVEKGP